MTNDSLISLKSEVANSLKLLLSVQGKSVRIFNV